MSDQFKRCSRCKEIKSHEEFPRDRRIKSGLGSWCKQCAREKVAERHVERRRTKEEATVALAHQAAKSAEWRQKNPETVKQRQRWYYIKYQYNLTRERYEEMLIAQDGRCAIEGCGRPVHSVDHDRSCCAGSRSCGKCVRGLLCQQCNIMLGLAGDDTSRLLAAAEYLAQARGLKDLSV